MITILVFIIGLIFGSFAMVLIYRVPFGNSIIYPSSHCQNCGIKIKFYDNIPLISYFILEGKCRYCKNKISIIYPIVEFITATLFLLTYIKFGLDYNFIKYVLFLYLLVIISFTDIVTAIDTRFETGVIPEIYLLLIIFLGLATSVYELDIVSKLMSFASGFLLLYLPSTIFKTFFKKDGIGDGDIILLSAIALFISYKSLGLVVVVASISGILIWLIMRLLYGKKIDKDLKLAFAPSLSLGAIVYIFWGSYLT